MVDSARWQTPGKDLGSTALAHKLWGSIKTIWRLCLKKNRPGATPSESDWVNVCTRKYRIAPEMHQWVWAQAWGLAGLRSALVWDCTGGVPAIQQLPNLPDQLPGGVIANTKQQPYPRLQRQNLEEGNLGVYICVIINAAKPSETSRPGLPQPEKQGLPFRSGPWVSGAPPAWPVEEAASVPRACSKCAEAEDPWMPPPITCLVIGILIANVIMF